MHTAEAAAAPAAAPKAALAAPGTFWQFFGKCYILAIFLENVQAHLA